MNKYLLPAGYEFQTVQHDFERLQQGKDLFDRNTIEALKTADNNNDRYEQPAADKEQLAAVLRRRTGGRARVDPCCGHGDQGGASEP
jgi:hypothetical protein